MVQLLLAHGAADYEADLTSLLFKAAKHGQADAVSALGSYTELNHNEQHKLLTKWIQNRSPETLAVISSLIPPSSPSVRTLTKSQSFLNVAFKEKSPTASPGLINAGLYLLSRNIIDSIPPGRLSLETQVLPGLVAAAIDCTDSVQNIA
jgi:hypothetical protein